MLNSYPDILALTDAQPQWWDQNGVPRFAPFEPSLLGVYPAFALLYEIRCQRCDRRMLIGCEFDRLRLKLYDVKGGFTTNTAESLASEFHFGDPPPHSCVGDSMQGVAIVAREVWERYADLKWVRRVDLENRFDLRPDWARDGGDDHDWPEVSRWQIDFEPEEA